MCNGFHNNKVENNNRSTIYNNYQYSGRDENLLIKAGLALAKTTEIEVGP